MIAGRQWGLVTLGLTLTLGVAIWGEMILRLKFQDACTRTDALLGLGLQPGASCQRQSRDFKVTYQINSLGLRNKEIGLEKKGERRILMLGDSFTEGTGVKQEETFSAILAKEMGIEVINAGISGYSTLHEYLWLKERGFKLQPDLVVLNINETDLVEAAKYHQIWEKHDFGNLGPELNKSQIDRVLLLNLIRNQLASLRQQGGKPKTTVFIASAGTDEEAVKQYWQLVRSDIERINFFARGKNVPLLVAWQPHGHQVSQAAWSEGRLTHGFMLGRMYPTEMPTLLNNLAQEVGFKFVDLSPAFKATDAARLYFPYDGHWTAEGHRLVAETLKEKVYDFLF